MFWKCFCFIKQPINKIGANEKRVLFLVQPGNDLRCNISICHVFKTTLDECNLIILTNRLLRGEGHMALCNCK